MQVDHMEFGAEWQVQSQGPAPDLPKMLEL